MSTNDLEKRLARKERDWQSMIRITHDFFHAWRKSVKDKQGEAAAKTISPKVRVVTESQLPRGGDTCTRRFSVIG